MWGALSDEMTGMSFTIAAGPRQRSHSQVRVPWDSRPYFTVSDSRLPFSLPPTTRRARVSSQGQSHIATDGQSVSQSVSQSWCRAPSGTHDQTFSYYYLTVTVLFCGAPSLTRGRVSLLYMLLGLPNAVFLWSESLGTRAHILLSQIWDFPFRRLLRLAGSRWRYSPRLHRGDCQSQSHIATNGQSASKSWCRAPPDIYFFL
jgi:hypothetical protein